ncbi:tyrosine-type recombinase/integrase [Hydrogenophaga sp. NFH-34]|uniref:tyrosine-type recombinase/integrase n=1 Tax=Hydrogenophaga sp. NFH-34 TaxID=2744446 RepID=UPI001F281739|nr:integrase family protein [Hydrogenophaga sp. NFH-34]
MSKQQNRVRITAGRVAAFTCPEGRAQAFLWDTDTPSMALRATPTGRKTYVFESRLNGATLRINIGTAAEWPIERARVEAQRLKMLVDQGIDPRELERQQTAEAEAKAIAAARQAVTVGEAWSAYIDARHPHWGELSLRDHQNMMRPGGEAKLRGKGLTKPGPLHHFAAMRLVDVAPDVVQAWATREAQDRPTRARLALNLLHAFLAWCAEQPEYAALVPERNPARSRRAREVLGKPKAKADALLREQLPAWFVAVRGLRNPLHAAYLQCLLLVGARPSELLALRWDDLNIQWKGLTLRDKDESKGGQDGVRVIPLTPYVRHLLASLPRRGPWVFAGTDAKGEPQPMSPPNRTLADVCSVAGIEHLTLHGLRRSFGTLSEWLELPAGVVAQIQGHKPSATAEKHYRVRPLDLLRVHHERLEAWILEQAGVTFDPKAEPGKLRAVAS